MLPFFRIKDEVIRSKYFRKRITFTGSRKFLASSETYREPLDAVQNPGNQERAPTRTFSRPPMARRIDRRPTAAPGLMADYTISTVARTNLPPHPKGK
jgi:hypothetical protein